MVICIKKKLYTTLFALGYINYLFLSTKYADIEIDEVVYGQKQKKIKS